jgi:hypothetical protein
MLEAGSRGCSALRDLLEDHVRAASWQELMPPLLPLLPGEALLRCCTHALPLMAPGAWADYARALPVDVPVRLACSTDHAVHGEPSSSLRCRSGIQHKAPYKALRRCCACRPKVQMLNKTMVLHLTTHLLGLARLLAHDACICVHS